MCSIKIASDKSLLIANYTQEKKDSKAKAHLPITATMNHHTLSK
jgi:hypothetical protein